MSTGWDNSSSGAAQTASLEVHLLGLVDFDAALALQEYLVFETAGRTDAQGTLLLCEHPPLITMGREASRTHLQTVAAELRRLEIDVRWLSRGGGAAVHAPGQLAIYPILPLDRLQLGLMDFRQRLEDAAAATCREVRVPAKRSDAQPGLWSRGGHVAMFGAAVKSWVSYHGMYLNVAPRPQYLRMVQTNATGDQATSLQAQRLRRIPMHGVRESLIRHISNRFGYERVHVYTGHPALRRETRRIIVHA
ncbi:MAG: lipoyl(octanoyl) transferase LipB [Maioricimonas sp. JB045]